MIILGIDPGLSGALALHADDGSCIVADMPVHHLARGGRAKRDIDTAGLARFLAEHAIGHAFVEQVGAMPGQGVSSVFAFGKGYGIVIGALAMRGIPVSFVPPQHWKRVLRVPAAKDGARARASQLMPGAAHQWAIRRGECNQQQAAGRAEAALIAYYGRASIQRIATGAAA